MNTQETTITTPNADQGGLLLPGLDGSNPLGFLAALGVLRVLSKESPIQMKWTPSGGTWVPVIVEGECSIDDLLVRLRRCINSYDNHMWVLDKKLPFKESKFRDSAKDALSKSTNSCRNDVDILASFGIELFSNDKGMFDDTALRMVRTGDYAGNGLLAYGSRICEETTDDNLRDALTTSWTYSDTRCALRWDPHENHSYALQWTDPSKEKTVSVRGANRLAMAAMPLMPTIPLKTGARTTCFGFPDGKTESMTWPLWNRPSRLATVQSILSLGQLQENKPSAIPLAERGVAAVYRCDRMKPNKYYRNFTPARCIVSMK